MNTQESEAYRLARELNPAGTHSLAHCKDAAEELRRLWKENAQLKAQRKPLSDEDLRVIENKINPNMRWRSSDEEGITLYPIEYYELVRAIEAAHGIKGDA